jgi:parallel beta-helix repeat protein
MLSSSRLTSHVSEAQSSDPVEILILCPQNTTYNVTPVSLTFTINESTSWMGYSLDNQSNVTISGNKTLTGLSVGQHSIIVCANDTLGNMVSSNIVYFTIVQPRTVIVPDDYPTIQAAINAASDEDTVFVRNGTYYENVVINKTVSLMGESKETTVIDGQFRKSVVYLTKPYINISGFKITHSAIWQGPFDSAGMCIVPSSAQHANICENTFTENADGISVCGSHNTISANNFSNQYWNAIFMYYEAYYNLIDANSFSNSSLDTTPGACGDICMYYYNTGNVIIENNFYGKFDGGGGIYNDQVASMYDNVIYHNNFFCNCAIPAAPASNTWDNGYPSGGNYWKTYSGTDSYMGRYQNETGSDGVGDTPYVGNANNMDHYPLMKPYGGEHDVGVTNVATSMPTVGQGYNMNVTVALLNYGVATETSNVTIYANATAIQTIPISLVGRNSITLIFTWNTTGFELGNYTISAYVAPVPSETDIVDNTYVDGIVQIIQAVSGGGGSRMPYLD